MSEGEETLGNPVEQLNPDWEMRYVIPVGGNYPNLKVNGPLIVANEDRDQIPLALAHEKLARTANIQTFKRGFCERDGEELKWVEMSEMDKLSRPPIQIATKEEFEEAQANGVKVIHPSAVK